MLRKQSPPRPAPRLCVELLESREVPATIYAVNAAGRLLTFDSSDPGVLDSATTITGLSSGEKIAEIEVQPDSGQLFGVSNLGRLYVINPLDGLATTVGAGTSVAPTGTNLGTGFNPLTELLHVVTNTGENLSISTRTDTVAGVGTSLWYAPGDVAYGLSPRVTALAYTNSMPDVQTTALYGIDHVRGTLVMFTGTPGQLRTIGSLGFAVTGNVGLAIEPGSNVAYATLQERGLAYSYFCEINLTTGAATVLGTVGSDRLISDIAIVPGITNVSPPPPVSPPASPPAPGTPSLPTSPPAIPPSPLAVPPSPPAVPPSPLSQTLSSPPPPPDTGDLDE